MKTIIKRLIAIGLPLLVSAVALAYFSPSATTQAASCVKGDKYTDFTGYVTGKDTLTVETKGGKKLCNDVKVNFASFVIHNDYNGKGFANNPTALPQTQYYLKTVTVKKGTTGKTTVTVSVPDACTNYQIDAYIGKVQTKITTSEGLVGTNAIAAKLFQKTKTDCSLPKVDACNTTTGKVEKVEAGKENTPPHTSDLSKCDDVTVCDTKTGTIVTITKYTADSDKNRYVDKDSDKCKVETCDTSTGTIVLVEKGKENTPPYSTTLDKCRDVTVCDAETGDIVTISKDKANQNPDRYVDQTSDKCKDTPEVPEEIPSTGPAEIISGVMGLGSLAGAGSMYLRSRRTLLGK